MKTITYYYTIDGKCPYLEWLDDLDKSIKVQVEKRVKKLRKENYGEHKPLQNSELSEIRMTFGKGYRIYYYDLDDALILFVGGSDKKEQKKVVTKCNDYFADFVERNK